MSITQIANTGAGISSIDIGSGTLAARPTDPTRGDMYNVVETQGDGTINYLTAYNGTAWVVLGLKTWRGQATTLSGVFSASFGLAFTAIPHVSLVTNRGGPLDHSVGWVSYNTLTSLLVSGIAAEGAGVLLGGDTAEFVPNGTVIQIIAIGQ